MESPHKRQKMSPANEEDFVPLGGDDQVESAQYGYGDADNDAQDALLAYAPSGPRSQREPQRFNPRNWDDPRNAHDKPKSKHALPGHEPWVLIKTKLGRYFVHNTTTKESFWRTPEALRDAVKDFVAYERQQAEKEKNARWAEDQLREQRQQAKAPDVNEKADAEQRSRRRRSESLQREDEEAMLAELAAQAEHAEEQDAKEALQSIKTYEPKVGDAGYDSEGSYEYVEVTDSEGEDDGKRQKGTDMAEPNGQVHELDEEGPVEFGEDDIAYQLAAMGQDYGLDPGEYGGETAEDYDEQEYDAEDQGLAISDEDAVGLFKEMLDEHRVNPYTPWDKLIADQSSILDDDRFTILASSRARKEAFDVWTKDAIARMKDERAKMEKLDPRIPYLAFLAEKATPKLYWPEFKRKYKREPELNDRKMPERDRERLYREHIARLKLPESSRKADLLTLLKSDPLVLNKDNRLEQLPQQVLSHLHYVSLPAVVRDRMVEQHIRSLPSAPDSEDGEADVAQAVEERKKRERIQKALAERERKVEEARLEAGKKERFAKRDLREEERELRRAMHVKSHVG